ncbi:MAG: polysaccharide deacetylase family protein, partial [Coriobacteriia bacterium]|nr:polysaccharide deacetylase family protein [Coriobacteriia bacterium]
ARCYGVGWQDWKKDGQTAGTTGQSRPMQAVEIKLSEGSELARTYDVFYRVHVAGKGWLSWARNGQSAGTIGFFSRIEAIQIVLVPNGGIPGRASAPGSTARPCITIGYSAQAHVAQTGWLAKVTGRKAVGTLGQSRQMNAFLINIDDAAGVSGSIQYRALVAGSGWQGWVSAGAIAGSVNNPKRIEAIGIRLTGELANQYDVYYRAHCASIGWLSWAKNGANAGTATLGLRLEAFEIVLALKGGPAPGSTAQPYMEKLRIRILDPSKPMIALTFDGGPSAYTTRVVNILDRYKARGTFFVIGNYVNNNPGIVRDAFMRGHEIAGHSMRHPDYTTLSYSAIQADILSTNQTIRNATGSPPPPFYRAPFGALNQNVRNASAGVGHSIIQWNVDTIDWRDQNTSIVYSRVMNNARHGAIVLFHDTQPTTLAAVEKAVPDLIARGYQLVTVSELMYYTKTSFVPGQVYYSG